MSFSLNQYIKKQHELINQERKAIRKLDNKLLKTPLLELEKTGQGIIDLVVSNSYVDSVGHRICTMKTSNERKMFIKHFKAGDKVRQYKTSPDGASECIKDVNLFTVAVILNAAPEFLTLNVLTSEEVCEVGMLDHSEQFMRVFTDKYVMVKVCDTFTYDVWDMILSELKTGIVDGPAVGVLKTLLLGEPVDMNTPKLSLVADTYHLNFCQENCVFDSMLSPILLVHGPPGTGKSTTLVSIIENLILQDQRVLVCAPSNVAVDQLLERISQSSQIPSVMDRMIRVGKLEKVAKSLESACLHMKTKILNNEVVQRDKARLEEVQKLLIAVLDDASLGDEAELRQKEKEQTQTLVGSEKRCSAGLLNAAAIVGCTLTLAQTLDCNAFDVVVIDEAAQATEVACLAAILRGKRLIMAGDHLQLAPTVLSQWAGDLSMSLFERCSLPCAIPWLPSVHRSVREKVVFLDTQHRMNDTICQWSSQNLYKGRLKTSENVRNKVLADSFKFPQYPLLNTPWMFLDTFGDYKEGNNNGSKSNKGEALLVTQLVKFFINVGATPESIGIVTPYKNQVHMIQDSLAKSSLRDTDLIDVKTIDGYQGGEKDIVLVSCVRSNEAGDLGFLTDARRMNVAITRAKRFVGIIGDAQTLRANSFQNTLIEHRPEHVYSARTMKVHDNNGLTFN